MNADEMRDKLADYLGDELQPEERRRFEEYAATDPSFAAEVESLRETLRAMRSLDESAGEASSGTTHGSARMAWARAPALLRYAAIILLAFSAGYLVPDRSETPRDVSTATDVQPKRATDQTEWQMRLAMAYSNSSSRSGLARSLVALARATK